MKDKLSMNWAYMKEKALEFNKSVGGEDNFKASYWWIFIVSKRSGIVGLNNNGEAREKSDEYYQKIINDWKLGLWDETRKKRIPPLRIYNSDKSGLLYAKTPQSHLFIEGKGEENIRSKTNERQK